MPVLGKGPEGQPAFPFSGKTEKNEYSCQHLNGVMILPGKALSDCLYETCHSSLHIDGESGGIRQDLTVSIEKKPLKIILPVV